MPCSKQPKMICHNPTHVLQAAVLYPGECAQLCQLQEVDGVDSLHAGPRQDGLPVHLWDPPGGPVRRGPDSPPCHPPGRRSRRGKITYLLKTKIVRSGPQFLILIRIRMDPQYMY